MSTATKKRILISPEQKTAQLGAFFQELGFELCTNYDKKVMAEYLFVVDDYLSELKSFPRIQTKKELPLECQGDVRAFIDIANLDDPSVKKLLSSYFKDGLAFDLVDRYSKDFKNVYGIKVQDYLNVGAFIDSIVIEAYKNKFDFELIRNYLNCALPYALKQAEKDNNLTPLDVTFSYSEEGFAVQIAMGAVNFNSKNDFKMKNSGISEFSSNANYFDASYFSKRERLMLSSLWFKDQKLKDFRSSFFTEISGRTAQTGNSLISILDGEASNTHYVAQPPLEGQADIKISGLADDEEQDAIFRIAGGKTPEDLSATRIKGSVEDLSEEEWRVKSSEKTPKELSVTRIKGSVEDLSEEEWRVKSSGSVEKTDDGVMRVKSLGQNPEANDSMAIQKVEPDSQREKLEGQLVRMKKVMEQMKSEMLKLRSEAEVRSSSSGETPMDPEQFEVSELKNALNKTLELVKNKDKISSNQRADFEQLLSAKDERIAELESRMGEIKSEFSRSKEFADEEKMEQMLTENKSLSARLDLANRKINIISDNMEKQDNVSSVKKDKEIVTLKSNMQMAQALIEKFKQERNDLEVKLSEEKEKSSKFRDEKAHAGSSKEESEKEKQFMIISTEKKIVEEKFRAQSIELKKLEQKLRFTVAQLEESQRKKTLQPAQAAAKSNDVYIKQLENANARIADFTADLAERKKEIMKLKQENNVLTGKLTEVERKLGNIDKKAA